jgi:adhesin HecA-like repeat protein
VQTVTGAKTFNAGTLILAAGTSTASPLTISSGTDVSNPANGTLSTDFDGYVLNAHQPKLERYRRGCREGICAGIQYVTNSSAVTLTVQTANNRYLLQRWTL